MILACDSEPFGRFYGFDLERVMYIYDLTKRKGWLANRWMVF